MKTLKAKAKGKRVYKQISPKEFTEKHLKAEQYRGILIEKLSRKIDRLLKMKHT